MTEPFLEKDRGGWIHGDLPDRTPLNALRCGACGAIRLPGRKSVRVRAQYDKTEQVAYYCERCFEQTVGERLGIMTIPWTPGISPPRIGKLILTAAGIEDRDGLLGDETG